MKMKFAVYSLFFALCSAGTAHANWQYPGNYLGDGWYEDDGSRFTISVRGGASIGTGKINNEIGSMTVEYFVNPNNLNEVVSGAYYEACVDAGGCLDFVSAGLGNIADLPANKNYSSFSFAAGASIGFTIPYSPQWRIEAGWDHIAETEYNASPLFEGDLKLQGGDVDGVTVNVQSGGATSDVSTDIISVMAFHDFFDGGRKPIQEFIPYIGFGIGYADSKTTLTLADLYGDLSWAVDLLNYGQLDDYGVLQFYTSEKSNSNIAGLLAVGFSYGLSDGMFLDLGARLTYIPKVKWALSNEDGTKHRDWYSASSLIYANIMLGLRFEF